MCLALKSGDILRIIQSNKAMENPQLTYFKGGITQTKPTQSIDIEAVYKMLKIYEDNDGKSLMTTEQKLEIEKRSALYKQGKLKTSTWAEVKKRTRTA